MADRGQKSALQRKAELARARLPRHAAPPEFGARPGKALVRALKRAGMPLDALMLEPRDPTIALDQTLAEVTEMLPEGGLLVVLEGPDRTRGLLHLHQALLDGLIEVQTTGSVDSTDGPARPATRIDAALSREFIDAALSGLQTELEDAGLPTFVAPLKFGTALEDRRQLPLLLPERGFSLFRVSVDMANGIKAGTALIALPPGEPAAMRGDRAEPDATWQAAFRASVVQARVPLVSVLFRRSMPIQAILALQAGDVIAFEHDALNTVRVEDSLQRAVLKGRLGQAGGKRA
ncbi:MAG: FliM/FliN family flagellar motor switch protein, partial [Pseudomonadota bacterium]